MKKAAVVLDAKGKSLGRVATEAALYLRGKRDPHFEWHIMPEQEVVIKNAKEVRFSGRKFQQRTRERYSGYPGGLKKIPYETEFKKSPAEFVRRTIAGMIPANRLKKGILKHLTIHDSE